MQDIIVKRKKINNQDEKPASFPKQRSEKTPVLFHPLFHFCHLAFEPFSNGFSPKRLSVQSAFVSRCGKQLIQLALVVHLYFYDPCGISIFVDVFR